LCRGRLGWALVENVVVEAVDGVLLTIAWRFVEELARYRCRRGWRLNRGVVLGVFGDVEF
jgi:hypothetical protein